MSKIEVDKVDPQSGTALEIGTSGDTVTVPSGVGLTLTDSTLLLPTTINTDKIDPKSGTTLEIGTSGDTITVPSGATFNVAGTLQEGGSALVTGILLQVVQGTTSTETRNSTNTLADTTLTAAITPSATSSKILVTVMQNGCDKSSGNSGNQMILKLLRGASIIQVFANNYGYTNSALTLSFGTAGTVYLDSPSSTSELTYKTQLSNGNNTAAVGVQGTGGEASTITLMEIAG